MNIVITRQFKKDIDSTIQQLVEASKKNQDFYKNNNILSSIYYLSLLSKEINFEIPKDFKEHVITPIVQHYTHNFKGTEFTLLMMNVEIANIFQINIQNESIIKDYVIGLYNAEKNVFELSGREDLLVNFAATKILYTLSESKPDIDLKSILNDFKDESNGGYLTLKYD